VLRAQSERFTFSFWAFLPEAAPTLPLHVIHGCRCPSRPSIPAMLEPGHGSKQRHRDARTPLTHTTRRIAARLEEKKITGAGADKTRGAHGYLSMETTPRARRHASGSLLLRAMPRRASLPPEVAAWVWYGMCRRSAKSSRRSEFRRPDIAVEQCLGSKRPIGREKVTSHTGGWTCCIWPADFRLTILALPGQPPPPSPSRCRSTATIISRESLENAARYVAGHQDGKRK
jgi:hypothetical protein